MLVTIHYFSNLIEDSLWDKNFYTKYRGVVKNLHKKTLDKNINIQYIFTNYICSHMYYRIKKSEK